MLTNETARARVARGAAHLDVARPGWFALVDTSRLRMSSCTNCVLGQLSGDESSDSYANGANAMGLRWSGPLKETVALGFFCDMDSGYDELQVAWLELIADRRRAFLNDCSASASSMAAVDPVGELVTG